MPSCTVPTCSNSEAISHITQCEMPFSRKAIAVAAATAPTPTTPVGPQPQRDAGGAADQQHAEHWLTISNAVTSRIWPCTVPMNSCIALRAKVASRCECENSLTVAMLV
jgi:hypothetical protein